MKTITEYDYLAHIYSDWSNADPAAALTLRFYLNISSDKNTIVELGIGNGRIALELAKQGKKIIGIDVSETMIKNCEEAASALGVADNIRVIKSDIRDFSLDEPADWIIIPFRTIGHLLSLDDKRQGLTNIYNQLTPGGTLIFDHYIFNKDWARSHDGISRLMCKKNDLPSKRTYYVWDTYLYQFEQQLMDCTITIEETNDNGLVLERSHNNLSFSWIYPNQVKDLLIDTGFEIVEVFGSFNKDPLVETSKEQIWVVRRPR